MFSIKSLVEDLGVFERNKALLELKIENPMAWDINLSTLDGYDGKKIIQRT
jgi:hypothetical protein